VLNPVGTTSFKSCASPLTGRLWPTEPVCIAVPLPGNEGHDEHEVVQSPKTISRIFRVGPDRCNMLPPLRSDCAATTWISTSKGMSSRLQRQRGLKLSHIAKQLGVIPHTEPLIEVGASCHASSALLVVAQAAKRP
jgi:hypothetical protein